MRRRLPLDTTPPSTWAPPVVLAKRKSPSPDRLLPVARLSLAGSEVWACVRVQRAAAGDLVLLNPSALPMSPVERALSTDGVLSRLLRRKSAHSQEARFFSGYAGRLLGVVWLRMLVRPGVGVLLYR